MATMWRHRRRSLGLAVCLAMAMACVHAARVVPPPPPNPAAGHLVWPPAPARPRITYLRDVILSRDRRPPRGFWHRLGRLFGKAARPRIIRPYGVAVGDEGALYIADPGAFRVHILDLSDGSYRFLPDRRDHLALLSPVGVVADGAGGCFVSDSAAAKVYRFDAGGRLQATIERFHRPTGVAFNQHLGRLYVVDTGDHRVRVFTATGDHLFDFGFRGDQAGAFNYPTNISVTTAGTIYVVDSMNFRVQRFDPDGNPLGSFGAAGDGPGTFSKPRGVALDSDGHIYVADATFDNVQIFDGEGRVLLYFGSTGTGPGHFYLPAGVAIDDRDRIYVADSYNRRVEVFQYLRDPLAAPMGAGATLPPKEVER